MIFNGDSDDQDLCTLADKFVQTDDTDFPLKEKAMYANQGLRIILGWIISVYGGWVMDDNNNTGTLPSATTGLNADQTTYALPDIIDLLGVSYKIQGGDSWIKLNPITIEEMHDRGYSEAEFMRLSGSPMYYRPVGNAIKIYPAANFTQSASLGCDFTRDITPFTSTSTNVSPGFVTTMHEAVAVFMALQFAKINSLPVAGGVMRGGFKTGLLADWSDYEMQIKAYYKERYRELFPQAIKHRQDVVSDYI